MFGCHMFVSLLCQRHAFARNKQSDKEVMFNKFIIVDGGAAGVAGGGGV